MILSLVLEYVPSKFWLSWGQQIVDYKWNKSPDRTNQIASHRGFGCLV